MIKHNNKNTHTNKQNMILHDTVTVAKKTLPRTKYSIIGRTQKGIQTMNIKLNKLNNKLSYGLCHFSQVYM